MESFKKSMYQLIVERQRNLPKMFVVRLQQAKRARKSGLVLRLHPCTNSNNIKWLDDKSRHLAKYGSQRLKFIHQLVVNQLKIEGKLSYNALLSGRQKDGTIRPISCFDFFWR